MFVYVLELECMSAICICACVCLCVVCTNTRVHMWKPEDNLQAESAQLSPSTMQFLSLMVSTFMC